MTVEDVLNLMEGDQPIRIIHANESYVGETIFVGLVEDFKGTCLCELTKILTPDDNDGTIDLIF